MLWSQIYKHNPFHIVLLQKPGRIATLNCYDWTLFG
jgi:hypothetical protein